MLTRARHHEAGGSAVWLAVVLLLLAVVVVVLLWGPGRRSTPVIPPLPNPPSPVESQAFVDELAELGDRLAQVMDNQRDTQPLIERAEALAIRYPDSAEAHMLHGQILMYSGRLDPAIKALQRSLEVDPKQADIHRLIASGAMQMDRLEVARQHYEKALDLEPDNSQNALFLANVEFKLAQFDKAVKTLQGAIRRDSQLAGAYALLSDIYVEQGKTKLAMDQIERAIEATPAEKTNSIVVYTLKRAALLRQDNQPAESLAVLDALPREVQYRPDVLRDTATSWGMLGKPMMAAELYEKVLTVDPSNDYAAAEAARWWIKADDVEAAARNLKTLRRINPRHPEIPELDTAIKGD